MKRRPLIIARILVIVGFVAIPGSPHSFAQNQGTLNPPSQDISGLVVTYNSDHPPCDINFDLEITDSVDSRLEGTVLCTNNDYTSVLQGDRVKASVTLRNNGRNAITMQRLQVSGRGPGARSKQWNAPNVDWPADTNITLQPGQEYTYSRLRYFNEPVGDYFAETTFQDTSGKWHGIGPFPRVWFDVVAGEEPTDPPPSSGLDEILVKDSGEAIPWPTDCGSRSPCARFPLALTMDSLPTENWQPALKAAAAVWNNVGTKAQFAQTTLQASQHVLTPVISNVSLPEYKLAVGEVRVVLESQTVLDIGKAAGMAIPFRDPNDPDHAIAALIVMKDDLSKVDFTRPDPSLPFWWGWAPIQRPLVLDAQSVLAHELGHVLGLNHTPAGRINVMSSVLDDKEQDNIVTAASIAVNGFWQRTLGREDLDQLTKLYGPGSKKFTETGKSVEGPFWHSWLGGRSSEDAMYSVGLPVSDARDEVSSTDGKTYKTQWFERARMEYHPENEAPYDVLFGLLGATAAQGRQNEAPFRPVPKPALSLSAFETESNILSANTFNTASSSQRGLQWFPETQHTLGDNSEGGRAIAHFWTQLGGIPQFGFPISQPFVEKSKDDGKMYLVQYFERQRFEYHPENKGTRYEVLLGRLGTEQLDQKAAVPSTPKPSGTSNRIAFTSNRDGNYEIYVMNADGTGQTRLTNNSVSDRSADWSPDGERIAFDSNRDGNYDIYVMNADGTGQTRLTSNPADDSTATWSPDGKRIAFTSHREGNWEIYVMNADGTEQARLTNNRAYDDWPSWSPDGRRIAFYSDRDGNLSRQIYIMNADGTGQTRISNNSASDTNPSWSRDASRIAFDSIRDGSSLSDIYVMNADGTEQARLTNNPAADRNPTWSPDGKRIAFVSFRDGNWDVYVMNATGTDQTRITTHSADWPSWSPK